MCGARLWDSGMQGRQAERARASSKHLHLAWAGAEPSLRLSPLTIDPKPQSQLLLSPRRSCRHSWAEVPSWRKMNMEPTLMVKTTRFQWLLDQNVLIDNGVYYCRWKTVA